MNFINTGLDDQILKSMDAEFNPSDDLVKAMSKQGLVQKEIQVRGKNGQTFTRKQWVKSSDTQVSQTQPKTQQDSSSGKSVQYSYQDLCSMKMGSVITRKTASGHYIVYEKQDNNASAYGGWSVHRVTSTGTVSQLSGDYTRNLRELKDWCASPKIVTDNMKDIHNVFLKVKPDIKHTDNSQPTAKNLGTIESKKYGSKFTHVTLPESEYKQGDVVCIYNSNTDVVGIYQNQGNGHWFSYRLNASGGVSQMSGVEDSNVLRNIKYANEGNNKTMCINPTASMKTTILKDVHNVFLKTSPNIVTGKEETASSIPTPSKSTTKKPSKTSNKAKDSKSTNQDELMDKIKSQTKYKTMEELADAFDEAINSGENNSSDYNVDFITISSVENYKGNGPKGAGTTDRVRITASVTGVRDSGEKFTKDVTISCSASTSGNTSDEVKFDKTKSGKVGGIQIGKELAAVVKTAPTGAKKLREVTDKDTGKTYSIYTDTSSSKPDGIVAVENVSTQKESKDYESQSFSTKSEAEKFWDSLKVGDKVSVSYQIKDTKSGRVFDNDPFTLTVTDNGDYTLNGSDKIYKRSGAISTIFGSTIPNAPSHLKKQNIKVNKDNAKVGSSIPKTKDEIQKLVASGKSKDDIMKLAKDAGITWKEHDHAGINWMRACMAMTGTSTKGNK